MSDPLADLKRRAYARPADDGDAAAAQVELARLAVQERPVAWHLPRPPRFEVLRRGGTYVLAIAALAAAAGATQAVVAHQGDSLEVFDRPPATSDVAPPDWLVEVLSSPSDHPGPRPDTLRWLDSYKQFDLFAYRTESDDVCLLLVEDGSAGGTCATPSEFSQNGVKIESRRGLIADERYISAQWGPTGRPQFHDAQADGDPT